METRNLSIVVRVNCEEKEKLISLAKNFHRTNSDFIRYVISALHKEMEENSEETIQDYLGE